MLAGRLLPLQQCSRPCPGPEPHEAYFNHQNIYLAVGCHAVRSTSSILLAPPLQLKGQVQSQPCLTRLARTAAAPPSKSGRHACQLVLKSTAATNMPEHVSKNCCSSAPTKPGKEVPTPAYLEDEDCASNSTAAHQVLAGQGAVVTHHQHVHLKPLSLGLLHSQPKVQAVPCSQKVAHYVSGGKDLATDTYHCVQHAPAVVILGQLARHICAQLRWVQLCLNAAVMLQKLACAGPAHPQQTCCWQLRAAGG